MYCACVDAAQWSALAAGVLAAAGVASAVVAAVAARQANAAAREAHAAAREANAAAGPMADIEQDRFWRESAPVFRFRCHAGVPQSGFALLMIQLYAGQQLVLDSVQVTILSTVDIRPWNLTASELEEARQEIWAGWQFNTFFGRPEGHAANPRQSRPRKYSRADGMDFEELLLRETAPPTGSRITREEWQEYWRRSRLRLQLECRVGDNEPWVVYHNVEVENPGPMRASGEAPLEK